MDDFGSQIEDFKNCEEATTNTPDFSNLVYGQYKPCSHQTIVLTGAMGAPNIMVPTLQLPTLIVHLVFL